MANPFERFKQRNLDETAYDNTIDPEEYDPYVREKLKRDRLAHHLVQDFFLPEIPPIHLDRNPAAVLDIAAGTGIYSQALSDAGYTVTATDKSERALSYLTAHDERIATISSDMNESFPFPAGSFDGVTTLWGNRYIKDPTHFTNEVYRVLKHGGSFVWPIFLAEAPLWKARNRMRGPTLSSNLAILLENQGFDNVRVAQGDPSYALLREKIPPHQIPTVLTGVKGYSGVREVVPNRVFSRQMQLYPAG